MPHWTTVIPDFRNQVMAVERVERLLRDVTSALEAANVRYAVIGGNAVAAWISTKDEGAVRATKDVDLLVRRQDMPVLSAALHAINMMPAEVLGVHMFLDRQWPNPKTGVHLLFAGEIIRPHDKIAAPDLDAATRAAGGFMVIDLPSLVRMKLLAFRRIDQVHIEDLLSMDLIDEKMIADLPEELQARFREIQRTK